MILRAYTLNGNFHLIVGFQWEGSSYNPWWIGTKPNFFKDMVSYFLHGSKDDSGYGFPSEELINHFKWLLAPYVEGIGNPVNVDDIPF